jgi:hypothetical protein
MLRFGYFGVDPQRFLAAVKRGQAPSMPHTHEPDSPGSRMIMPS